MPLYSDSVLDEVRNAVNIVSLVSEYVALKKRGRNHVARCPFHTEKNPSFNVSEEKQIFMCFGCGVGGDAFKFIMLIEHLSFPDAIRFIAERHGIQLPEPAHQPEPSGGVSTDTLRQANVEAAAYFHWLLLESEEGRSALEYLQRRGVTRQTIEKFQLGYSPAGGDGLIQRLSQKGFSLEVLLECGLAKRSEDGTRCYDGFRGRIMFPITDVRGRVIAFGGRAMGDHQPKYLNSPETRLYNKSRNLFGLSFSKEAVKKLDFAVLVEGYMDFVVPFQYGVENLVASLGTSLTPQQVQLLGRYTREVVVSYDPDAAGVAATQRSLDLFLEEDFRVRVLSLPDGEDPDTFIRRAGAEEYGRRLRAAAPYLDFVLETAMHRQGSLDNPRSKIQIINIVLPYLVKLPNPVERSDYVSRIARRLRIEDQQLLAEVKRAAQQKRTRLADAPLATVGTMKFAEKRLLQALLLNPALQSHVLARCELQDFSGLAAEKIFAAIIQGFHAGDTATFEDLRRKFAGESEQAMLVQVQMEESPEDLTLETAGSFCDALRALRLASYKQEILSRVEAEINEAAQRKDNKLLNRLMEQKILLSRELISLSRK
jgi:DNA primase